MNNLLTENVRLYKSILSVSDEMPSPLVISALKNCNLGNVNCDILSVISLLTTAREILNKIQQITFEHIMDHLGGSDVAKDDVKLIHDLLQKNT